MAKEKKYLFHPYYILITLVLASITTLFLGFSAAYLYNRVQAGEAPVSIPDLFYLNTFLLIGSSVCLVRAKKHYREDKTFLFQSMLLTTLILSVLFLLGQIFAWNQLIKMNIGLRDGNMASYLYVVSGLHFFHVIAGIPFLTVFTITAIRYMKKPTSVLVYFSDPDKKRKLNILTIYWHFLDGLWIYLVVFFLINMLI